MNTTVIVALVGAAATVLAALIGVAPPFLSRMLSASSAQPPTLKSGEAIGLYRRHVDKLNANDIEAFVNDYTETVDCYYNVASVARERIAKYRKEHHNTLQAGGTPKVTTCPGGLVVVRDAEARVRTDQGSIPASHIVIFKYESDAWRIVTDVDSTEHKCLPDVEKACP